MKNTMKMLRARDIIATGMINVCVLTPAVFIAVISLSEANRPKAVTIPTRKAIGTVSTKTAGEK